MNTCKGRNSFMKSWWIVKCPYQYLANNNKKAPKWHCYLPSYEYDTWYAKRENFHSLKKIVIFNVEKMFYWMSVPFSCYYFICKGSSEKKLEIGYLKLPISVCCLCISRSNQKDKNYTGVSIFMSIL